MLHGTPSQGMAPSLTHGSSPYVSFPSPSREPCPLILGPALGFFHFIPAAPLLPRISSPPHSLALHPRPCALLCYFGLLAAFLPPSTCTPDTLPKQSECFKGLLPPCHPGHLGRRPEGGKQR